MTTTVNFINAELKTDQFSLTMGKEIEFTSVGDLSKESQKSILALSKGLEEVLMYPLWETYGEIQWPAPGEALIFWRGSTKRLRLFRSGGKWSAECTEPVPLSLILQALDDFERLRDLITPLIQEVTI